MAAKLEKAGNFLSTLTRSNLLLLSLPRRRFAPIGSTRPGKRYFYSSQRNTSITVHWETQGRCEGAVFFFNINTRSNL